MRIGIKAAIGFGAMALVSSSLIGATSQPAAAAVHDGTATTPIVQPMDGSVGGWYVDNHLTYDEILANKSMTTTMANVPSKACAALGAIPALGVPLAAYCYTQVSWWSGVAKEAQKSGRCFRVVVPAHNPNWAYPSTHTRSWCR